MTFLIIEDDDFHFQVVERALLKAHAGALILRAATEKVFVQRLNEFIGLNPSLVIVDQMLPWTDEEDADPYTDAPNEGPLRAGYRCIELLRSLRESKAIPVIFFTNLEQKTVPPGVAYVRKRADPKLVQLMDQVKICLNDSCSPSPP
ncbi:MAG: hypothetical protein NTV52_01500 [Acidobacteria bacterium]|nr:hypothetical protein [Acidobacteriota bacterium]